MTLSSVAQLAEQVAVNHFVGGSSPSGGAFKAAPLRGFFTCPTAHYNSLQLSTARAKPDQAIKCAAVFGGDYCECA